MHIAICDDNIADRKQMERLLGRESVARMKTSGNLYVDSFGNSGALMNAPMIYDLIYIDMTDLPPHGMEVAIALREMGVTSPIVMCISKINYRNYAVIPDNVFFLDKPIKTDELSNSVTEALAVKQSAVPTIEIRGEEKTYYVPEANIIYAYPDGHNMKIVLTTGETICQLGGLRELVYAVQAFDAFLILGKKYLINQHHIAKVKGSKVIMDDTSKIPLAFGDKKRIKLYADVEIPFE